MSSSTFECSVCFEVPEEPVVTKCGHLFCWSCLYRWMQDGHPTCPVCKGHVDMDSVIPLFARGGSSSRNSTSDSSPSPASHSSHEPSSTHPNGFEYTNQSSPSNATENDVPQRPRSQRTEPPPQNPFPGSFMGPHHGFSFSNWHLSAGAGFFPGMFLSFGNGSNRPLTREEQQQQMFSKLLLVLAVFVLILLLVF